jgi:hypothetical protein
MVHARPLSLWDSFEIVQYKLEPRSFSEDSHGRWGLNVTIEAPILQHRHRGGRL